MQGHVKGYNSGNLKCELSCPEAGLVTRKRLSARLNASFDFRDSVQALAEIGLGGIIIEATGVLGPRELSQTGKREVKALLRSAGLALDAVALPMRRSIAERDQWDDRLFRMQGAMALAYELAAPCVLVSPGATPHDEKRKAIYTEHLGHLAEAAERQGVSLVCEPGMEPVELLREVIRELGHPSLALSLDLGRLTASGQSVEHVAGFTHELVKLVYATDPEFMGAAFGARGRMVNWPETLEVLEEIDYRGRLIIWPDDSIDLKSVIAEMGRRLGATPKF